jgi:phage baseplate assembly protein W
MKVFGGRYVTVDQDTTDEVMQCVRAVISTVRGQRENLPSFGLDDDLTFALQDIDPSRIEAALSEWESRAQATITIMPQTVDTLLQVIRVQVEDTQHIS